MGKYSLFDYYKFDYQGLSISFRRNKATDVVEILIDDNLAKAMGHASLRQMVESGLGFKIDDGSFDGLVEQCMWMEVRDEDTATAWPKLVGFSSWFDKGEAN